MDNNKKVLIGLIVILCMISIVGTVYAIKQYKKSNDADSSDAIKFKDEYEALNAKKSDSGKEFKTLEISKNNPIKYINDEEALDIIKNKSGIIYMGFANCPWCRNAVPNLLNAATSTGTETIYYLDLTGLRDVLEFNKKGKIVTTVDGSKAYMEMLTILDEYLSDYMIKDSKGEKVSTGEKRILAPTVLAITDGKVAGVHVNTVTTHITGGNGYIDMTDEENEELTTTYVNMMLKVLNSACDDGC